LPTLSNGEGLGTFAGERATNSFLTSVAATPYLPDTVGGPAVLGKVTDSFGFEGKAQLDTLKTTIPANNPLSFASIDSSFVGFDEIFISNLTNTLVQGIRVNINGIGTETISTLAPGESWTTLVPDGNSQGLVSVSSTLGGKSFDSTGLGSNFIIAVPEPSTFVLLGIGVLSLLAFGRWRLRWVVLAGSIFLVVSPMEAATVAYYRFENGTANTAASGAGSILDSSINGFNGTPFDAPVYGSNIPVNPVLLTGSSNSLSMNFNGTAWQRVNVPDNPSFQLTHSLTLEAYVNLRSIYQINWANYVLFRGDDRGGFDPYKLFVYQDNSGAAYFGFGIDGPQYNVGASISAPIPSLNQWFHIAGTLDDTTGVMDLYINGVLAKSTVTLIRPLGPLDPRFSPGLGIGNLQSSNLDPFYSQHFDGLIDEVRISDVALTPDQFLNVPEPSTFFLLGIGAISLLAFGRRRNRYA